MESKSQEHKSNIDSKGIDSKIADYYQANSNLPIISSVESSYKLSPLLTISGNTSEVFCVRFSNDGNYIAAGCGDGSIRIFNVSTGGLAYNLQGGSNLALPTTSIRFRPDAPNNKSKNILISSNAAGTLNHWHMTSGKSLFHLEERGKSFFFFVCFILCNYFINYVSLFLLDNQIFCLDYSNDGNEFVTAGKDARLRIYDESTKTVKLVMKEGKNAGITSSAGHSNRIFSVKYHPTDNNLIISGGWDNTIQIWDTRIGYSVSSIYGPHVCGDSIDVNARNEILTGSYRYDNPLQIWDLRSTNLIQNIWSPSGSSGSSSKLYTAQYSKQAVPKFIGAGGCDNNEVKIFDCDRNYGIIGTITGFQRGIFTLDFSPETETNRNQPPKVAIAGGDSLIRIFEIVPKHF